MELFVLRIAAMKEIRVPLVGSTITPIVVFLPLISITGVNGMFFRALALTGADRAMEYKHDPKEIRGLEMGIKPLDSAFGGLKEDDFLVVYDEYSERHDSIRSRAYFLYHSQGHVHERQRPQFVSPDSIHDLTVVPLLHSMSEAIQISAGPYAIATNDPAAFTLFSDGRSGERFELPSYNDAVGQVGRALLTPVTVTADFTIVGGYVFLWAWANGDLNDVH